jgi:hypothetical protein
MSAPPIAGIHERLSREPTCWYIRVLISKSECGNVKSNVNTFTIIFGKVDNQLELSSTDDVMEPRVYAKRARQSWKSEPQPSRS